MIRVLKQSRRTFVSSVLAVASVLAFAGVATAATPSPYYNGFETDTYDWTDVTQVMSGTHGIASADGTHHGEAVGGAFTRWGGYTDEFRPGGYTTSVDIYLDPSAGAENDTRFDWTSAVSKPDGTHRRDFVFNAGFYDDETGPGAGTDRFVVSAGNNAGRGSSFPKNTGHDPIAIDDAGWYTFQHDFRDDGTGVLEVELSIIAADGSVVHAWTLSDASDAIGSTVGGNRYGWFAQNDFAFLAIDNARLAVPFPISKDECKKGAWRNYDDPAFKNQGACVSWVAKKKH